MGQKVEPRSAKRCHLRGHRCRICAHAWLERLDLWAGNSLCVWQEGGGRGEGGNTRANVLARGSVYRWRKWSTCVHLLQLARGCEEQQVREQKITRCQREMRVVRTVRERLFFLLFLIKGTESVAFLRAVMKGMQIKEGAQV